MKPIVWSSIAAHAAVAVFLAVMISPFVSPFFGTLANFCFWFGREIWDNWSLKSRLRTKQVTLEWLVPSLAFAFVALVLT